MQAASYVHKEASTAERGLAWQRDAQGRAVVQAESHHPAEELDGVVLHLVPAHRVALVVNVEAVVARVGLPMSDAAVGAQRC